MQIPVWDEVRLVQKGERHYHPGAGLKGFRIRNPKCDLGKGFCKTEKINNLPKVVELDMTELGIGLGHSRRLCFSYHAVLPPYPPPPTESQEQSLLQAPGLKSNQEWFCSAQCMTIWRNALGFLIRKQRHR